MVENVGKKVKIILFLRIILLVHMHIAHIILKVIIAIVHLDGTFNLYRTCVNHAKMSAVRRGSAPIVVFVCMHNTKILAKV